MKTEDLQAKGLTQEQIDYVMAEYGKDINGIKQERDTYKPSFARRRLPLRALKASTYRSSRGRYRP